MLSRVNVQTGASDSRFAFSVFVDSNCVLDYNGNKIIIYIIANMILTSNIIFVIIRSKAEGIFKCTM